MSPILTSGVNLLMTKLNPLARELGLDMTIHVLRSSMA